MKAGLFVRCWALCVCALTMAGIAPAQTTMRIVASNTSSGNYQSYQTAGINILKALQPDVCLMQEFNVNTVSGGPNDDAAVTSFVNSTFGSGYYWYREPQATAQIPNGIVSRWPIIASGEWDDPEVTNRDFAWAQIDIPGPIDLYVVSMHILTTSATERNLEAQALINYLNAAGIPSNAYVCIGGDLNTGSRTEACITTLSSKFVTSSPYPYGPAGASQGGSATDTDTNASRNSPYDWVLPNSNLNAIAASTVYGAFTYPNGLVFDTRGFTQTQLDANFSPAKVANSGDTAMQHMAVVRTFTIPSSTPVTNGETATITTQDRAPSTAQIGNSAAMLSVNVSTTGADWDVGTIRFNLLGTAAQATVAAKVYNDTNNNGTVDAGETQIGSGSFASGTTNITLSPSPRASSGSPAHLLGVLSVLNTATSGSTMQLQLASNAITHAASGGSDVDPTNSAASSSVTTIVSAPAVPVVNGASVVINKYYNASTATGDSVELLVAQDHLDMRGMILKDFSSSMASDNGGKYTFTNAALWSDLRAGTIVVLRNDSSSADVTVGGSDYNLDLGLANTTYFTLTPSSIFDIGATEMVMIKSAGSGTSGVTGNIHTLGAGTATAQYTGITVGEKIRASASAATTQFVICDNLTTAAAGNISVLSNFNDGTGTAWGAVTTATLGVANSPANQDFITFLRGPIPLAADQVSGSAFQANWNPLVTAVGYKLDVATDAAFSNPVSGYYDVDVSGTSAMVSGLSGSSTYYYRVRGVNVEGTPSGTSVNTSVTTTAAVQDWGMYGN